VIFLDGGVSCVTLLMLSAGTVALLIPRSSLQPLPACKQGLGKEGDGHRALYKGLPVALVPIWMAQMLILKANKPNQTKAQQCHLHTALAALTLNARLVCILPGGEVCHSM
jgi:hypothetical protein